MLNWVVRYRPVLRFLRAVGTTDVLEVGSGSWGLSAFVDFPVTGCDVMFEPPISPTLRPVIGSIDALPFDSGQFECVVCLDTLEHIPPESRAHAVSELLRVTRSHLIVGCPVGPAAQGVDRRLYKHFAGRPGGAPVWLREHMDAPFPRREDIAVPLAAAGADFMVEGNESLWGHYALIRAESAACLGHALTMLSRKPYVRRNLPSRPLGAPYRLIFFAHKPGS